MPKHHSVVCCVNNIQNMYLKAPQRHRYEEIVVAFTVQSSRCQYIFILNTTAAMDAVLLEREVIIPSTTAQGESVCVTAITILGDDTVEGNETFRVTIQPTNPNDIVPTSRSTATVTIVDDDGMH